MLKVRTWCLIYVYLTTSNSYLKPGFYWFSDIHFPNVKEGSLDTVNHSMVSDSVGTQTKHQPPKIIPRPAMIRFFVCFVLFYFCSLGFLGQWEGPRFYLFVGSSSFSELTWSLLQYHSSSRVCAAAVAAQPCNFIAGSKQGREFRVKNSSGVLSSAVMKAD